MHSNRLALILSLLFALALSGAGVRADTDALSFARGKRILQPFDYHGVTLEAGPLKRQVAEVRNDYLRIPDDDLLKGFRARAGLPAPGNDLGGWYSSDTFHVFGQILSGLARMYAATGDEACRAKATRLLQGWMACIAPDGYFYYSRKPNALHYIYDKMVGGLTDMILYCHSVPARQALRRITDWAEKNLGRKRIYAFNAGDGDTEWYTLSENLYRAYLATGEKRYRDFADVWRYTEYWDLYARKADLFGVRPNGQRTDAYHAYSHVNTLGGLGAAYLVTGDRQYLQTLANAYDYLQEKQCFITGGFGPDEQLLPRAQLAPRLAATHNTFETQCGSWAAFKMAKYLLTGLGDARYGDWIERLVWNGIGASIPMTADGKVFYYSDYNLSGASKRNIPTGWTCCTGTRPMAVADYDDLIYFKTPDALYVNLYTPATVRWKVHGTAVTVRQETRFPENDAVDFVVSTAQPTLFALKLRVPGWLAGPITGTVNNQPLKLAPDALHWAQIARRWKTGDRLRIHLPMRLRVDHFDPDRPYPAAVVYGPVVLAFATSQAATARKIPLEGLETALVPEKEAPLTFHLASDPSIIARPFYSFAEDERYLLYLDPAAADRISYRDLKFSEGWNDAGIFRFSNRIGATVEYTFEGTGIRWMGYSFDDAGVAEVRIDDEVVGLVDQYGPGRNLPFDWKFTTLPFGKHTIRITVTADKNPQSKDHYLNMAGFEILGAK